MRLIGPSGNVPIGMPFHVRSQVPAHTAVNVTGYSPIVSGVHVTDGASSEPHEVLVSASAVRAADLPAELDDCDLAAGRPTSERDPCADPPRDRRTTAKSRAR